MTRRDRSARPRQEELRVAFFALLPPCNAATRAFCERPLPYLARHGIRGRVFPPSGSRLYRLLTPGGSRVRRPLGALYWYLLVLPRRLVQIARATRYDVVFIQRGLLRYRSAPLLEALVWAAVGRVLRRGIVVHCDDALWETTRAAYWRARFRLADVVLTGNSEIEAYAAACARDVRRLPGSLDLGRYPSARRGDRRPVTIGWTGYFPNEALGPIVPALARVCRRRDVRILVVTDGPFAAPELGGALAVERWTQEREFSLFADFDIGIMPLEDTAFARGKEAFKIKEYMAAGLPIVCSPVGHNLEVVEHGRTGLFAADEHAWVDELTTLVDLPELRAAMGAAGQRVVKEHYSLESTAALLAAALWDARDARARRRATRPLVEGGAP